MTDNEVTAAIAKLMAETAQVNAETTRMRAESRTLNVEFSRKWFEINKLVAATRKLQTEPNLAYAQTRQSELENGWLPVKVFAGAWGGVLAAIFAAAAGFPKFIEWFKP